MTHDLIVVLGALGVAGQMFVVLFLAVGLLAAGGLTQPLAALRRLGGGYAMWSSFMVAAIATGGSLVISEVGGYQPCELCWFERTCMYSLSILLLVFAWQGERWRARYLIPLPLAGAAVCIYHLLIENRVVRVSGDCRFNPAGVVHGTHCSTKWFNEFGYVTITTLALTAFLLLLGLLLLARFGGPAGADVGNRIDVSSRSASRIAD